MSLKNDHGGGLKGGRRRALESRKSADVGEGLLPEEFQLFKTVQSIILLRVWESSTTALG